MARRIRWQIVIAVISALIITGLLGALALSTTAVARPLAGGGYVEGVIGAAPQRINPLLDNPQSNPVGYDLAALLFDGLMRVGADGLPEQGLAQEWSVDDSGLVYTFGLRRGLRWHDGAPVTAGDVLFTLRALQTPDFPGDPALTNFWRAVLVDQLDDYTLRITLNASFAPFLSAARLPILPAHLLRDVPAEQWPEAPFNLQPVGTGPYRLQELTPERALLTANPHYYGGKPLIDSIELRFFSSPETALAALEQGAIQGLGYEPLQLRRDVALPPMVRGYRLPLDGYTTLTFNLREGPLTDAALRRALARGLDKDALLDAALPGQVARLDTPILPGWWAYDPGVQWYPVEREAAARALSELGFTPGADGVLARDGRRLELPLLTDRSPDHLQVAEQIAAQWGALGVAVPIEQLDGPELRARLRGHNFVLALHSFSRLGPDPDQYELWHSSQAAAGLNYAGLQDDEIDALIAAGRGEFEVVFRSDEYSAFQERWIELAPAIMLYQPLYAYAAVPQLGGTGFDQAELASSAVLFGRADRYRNVTRWFINSSREIRGDLRQAQ
jgi:peptide/nickel transport system substrate-binding protein